MVVRVAVLALLLAFGVPGVARAAGPAEDAAAISRGLADAVAAGRLSPAEAAEYRQTVARSRTVMGRVGGSRAVILRRVLGQVRMQANVYNRPRALALFSMLRENTDLLARRALPRDGTDYVGRGGVVYRVGWGYGLQFHPLANVIALNTLMYANQLGKAVTLAASLAARAVPRPSGGAVWEYYVPYTGGRPPWTSGMAQAIGAQAFARAARRLTAPDFFTVADAAYKVIPGSLVLNVSTGPWIRLYSFNGMVVLNAQLQTILSLLDYGKIVDNVAAIGLADRMENAARNLLPAFDTGAWSNYLPGQEAVLKYHLYHVELTSFLARRTNADLWQAANARFDRYTREPPTFKAADAAAPFYPWPRDGFRDSTRISFWVSKISSPTVTLGGQRFALGLRRRGWHVVVWRPGRKAARAYTPAVSARDLAGNTGTSALTPATVAVDRDPPQVTAKVAGRKVTWKALDPTTPWLRMWAVIERGDVKRKLDLGRRRLSGSLVLKLPRGTWNTALWVSDSSGNRTRVPLGPVPVPR